MAFLGSWTPCRGGLACLCRLTPSRRAMWSTSLSTLMFCDRGLGSRLRGGESWRHGRGICAAVMLLPSVETGGGGWIRYVCTRCAPVTAHQSCCTCVLKLGEEVGACASFLMLCRLGLLANGKHKKFSLLFSDSSMRNNW